MKPYDHIKMSQATFDQLKAASVKPQHEPEDLSSLFGINVIIDPSCPPNTVAFVPSTTQDRWDTQGWGVLKLADIEAGIRAIEEKALQPYVDIVHPDYYDHLLGRCDRSTCAYCKAGYSTFRNRGYEVP
jgi:hypothetical protein